jgi:hypothetical protein
VTGCIPVSLNSKSQIFYLMLVQLVNRRSLNQRNLGRLLDVDQEVQKKVICGGVLFLDDVRVVVIMVAHSRLFSILN